jgi:hypothetical protein
MPNTTTAGKLVIINGEEYTLSPPTWRDWEWLQNEMRGEFIRSWRAEKGDSTSEEDEKRIRAQAKEMSMLGPDGGSWMMSPSGMARVVYAMLRHEHPDIELEDVAQWVVIEQSFELKNDAMELVSANLPGGKNANGHAKKKNQASRSMRGQSSKPLS